MFTDKRSKKVIFVAHCILNQNVKIDACAYYPGIIREVMEIFVESDVGIVQLPCPELLYLGLDREAIYGENKTIESEDTRVALRMNEESSRNLCHQIVSNIIYQIDEYRKHGFQIIGLVGINCSPTCGVETTWSNDREHLGQGVFIKMINDELVKRQISMKMVGIKAKDSKQAVIAIKKILYN